MITAEIKVNGALIGYLYVVNVTKELIRQPVEDYKCEYYAPETEKLIKFKMKHSPEDGSSVLMGKCFAKLSLEGE